MSEFSGKLPQVATNKRVFVKRLAGNTRGQKITGTRLAAAQNVSELTAGLTSAMTIGVRWNEIIVGTAAHRAAVSGSSHPEGSQEREDAQRMVGWLAGQHPPDTPRPRNPQAVSNLLWAAAKLAVAKSSEPTFRAAAKNIPEGLAFRFSPQELANVAWAFATVHYRDNRKVFETLGEQVRFAVWELKEQELSCIAWAFARMRYNFGVFDAIREAILPPQERELHFGEQEMSNLNWAFTTARHPAAGSVHIWMSRVVEREGLHATPSKGLATLASCEAGLDEQLGAGVLPLVAEEACRRGSAAIGPRDADILCWAAAATRAFLPSEMFEVCAEAALAGLKGSNIRLLWSLSHLMPAEHPAVARCVASAVTDARHKQGFREYFDQDLANVVQAVVKTGPDHDAREIVAAACREASSRGLANMDARAIVSLCRGAVLLPTGLSPMFIEAGAEALGGKRMSDMGVQTMLWCLVSTSSRSPELYTSLSERVLVMDAVTAGAALWAMVEGRVNSSESAVVGRVIAHLDTLITKDCQSLRRIRKKSAARLLLSCSYLRESARSISEALSGNRRQTRDVFDIVSARGNQAEPRRVRTSWPLPSHPGPETRITRPTRVDPVDRITGRCSKRQRGQ
eukprot:Hpha_TRINITY_DN16734_c0_g2::TRINITY_DN16734_c0_g2_i5::g.79245::m.79245